MFYFYEFMILVWVVSEKNEEREELAREVNALRKVTKPLGEGNQ